MKPLQILAGIGIILVTYCTCYWIFTSITTERTVQAVCDYSRGISSEPAEEACGIAQDTANRAYVCPSSSAPTNQCVIRNK